MTYSVVTNLACISLLLAVYVYTVYTYIHAQLHKVHTYAYNYVQHADTGRMTRGRVKGYTHVHMQ